MKKINIFLVTILLFLTNTTWSKNLIQFQSDTLNIITAVYRDSTNDGRAFLEIYYPIIENQENNPILNKVNEFLEEEFKQSIAWYEEAKNDTLQMEEGFQFTYSFETDFSVAYNSKNFISIVLNHYQYTGGAHGNFYALGYNFNLINGNLISLEDVINSDSFDLLSLECEEVILNEYKANSLFDAGLFENEINILPDQDFYITPEALVLQFDPYEIAPYVMGQITAEIPFNRIMDILKTELPFKFE